MLILRGWRVGGSCPAEVWRDMLNVWSWRVSYGYLGWKGLKGFGPVRHIKYEIKELV
jgi:hypothetical protein